MPEAIPIRKPVSINAQTLTATRRIYVLGFNRCGTRSLTTAFKRAGIGCVHWDRNKLMLAVLSDLRSYGRINLCSHYPGSNAFLDLIHVPEHGEGGDHILSEGTLLHQHLIDSDPDAYFILNTRSVEGWIASRSAISTAVSWRFTADISAESRRNLTSTTCCWVASNVAQAHAEILNRFQREPHLRSLVFDIENTPYNILKEFLAEDYTLVGNALPRSGNG